MMFPSTTIAQAARTPAAAGDGLYSSAEDITRCLLGEKLYGDDFTPEQIAAWFKLEENAYFELATGSGEYEYSYHALNRRCGYRWLPAGRLGRALGLGSAYGHEFLPIVDRLEAITIVDPGAFGGDQLRGVPITRVPPRSDGSLTFPDADFDLITCFGVLHHIPNVSRLIGELFRCLRPGGYALLREPVISMGDWRRPRRGLTPCERGLPLHIFRGQIETAGFRVLRQQKCVFSGTTLVQRFVRRPLMNSDLFVAADLAMCRLPIWSRRYHTISAWQKLRPCAAYFVLRRDKAPSQEN